MDSARTRERAPRRRIQARKATVRRRRDDSDAAGEQPLVTRSATARGDEARRALADAERFLRQISQL